MRESLKVTIVFKQGEDGWIVASIPEVSGAHSQGRTRAEARANVIDAYAGSSSFALAGPEVSASADSEALELVIGG